MFPRFLFETTHRTLPTVEHGVAVSEQRKDRDHNEAKKGLEPTSSTASEGVGQVLPGYEKRSVLQRLRLWSYQPEDKTTYWEYFKRPFFLFAFPNVVLVSFCGILLWDKTLADTIGRLVSSLLLAAQQALSLSIPV